MTKRIFIYLIGMLILSIGITLNAQSALGVNPILVMPYLATQLTGIDLAITSLILYIVFIIIQLFVYLKNNRQNELLQLMLQIPISLLFALFFDLSLIFIPNFGELTYPHPAIEYGARFMILGLSLIGIGVGAAMMLMTNLPPTPADGIVDAFARWLNIKLGSVKNIFDIILIALTVILAIFTQNFNTGIGIGTILSMLLVGRIIHWSNSSFSIKI